MRRGHFAGIEAAPACAQMLVGANEIGRAGRGVEALRQTSSSSKRSSPMTVSAMPSGTCRHPSPSSSALTQMISKPPRRFSRRCAGVAIRPRQRRVGQRRAELGRAGKRRLVGRRQRRIVDRRQRQPPGIDHAARELGLRRKRQHGIAQPRSARECGDMKSVERVEWPIFSSAACDPLDIVARDQCRRRPPLAALPRASRLDSPHPGCRNWRRARRTATPDARHRR